jgi:hypothetical protein
MSVEYFLLLLYNSFCSYLHTYFFIPTTASLKLYQRIVKPIREQICFVHIENFIDMK